VAEQDMGMRMLAIACHRCERRGRLAQLIAHDCPKMQKPSPNI
jgi:hypothetical protein